MTCHFIVQVSKSCNISLCPLSLPSPIPPFILVRIMLISTLSSFRLSPLFFLLSLYMSLSLSLSLSFSLFLSLSLSLFFHSLSISLSIFLSIFFPFSLFLYLGMVLLSILFLPLSPFVEVSVELIAKSNDKKVQPALGIGIINGKI